jgi:hypothetical protein
MADVADVARSDRSGSRDNGNAEFGKKPIPSSSRPVSFGFVSSKLNSTSLREDVGSVAMAAPDAQRSMRFMRASSCVRSGARA